MEQISPYLLLAISMLACLGGGIARTFYCKYVTGRIRAYYLMTAAVSLLCALFLWAMSGFMPLAASPFTIYLGLLFGVITMVQSLSNAAALKSGPWSYTSVIISLATIVPTLSGFLFWGETVSVLQVAGIALLAGCFILSVDTSGENRRASLRWLALCTVAFLCTGAIGVLQKVHQSSVHKAELSPFLILAFLVSGVIAGFIWLIYPHLFGQEPDEATPVLPASLHPKNTLVLIAILYTAIGLFTAANNQFNLYLSGVMPAAVFFPVVNGGGLVLITVSSVLLFHEKLHPRQWLGLALGTLSVFLLCL